MKMPGVVAIFTGDDIAADKSAADLRLGDLFQQDGSPMRAGPHPALAQGKVRYVGDHVAVVIADTLARRAMRRTDCGRLRRAAGGRRWRRP